ncbi:hypothetical protein NLI96_g12141 [Meripilus lineatus]|uniref:Uncharacterized protein n=1 Tax=Meripilus lineatus TaxID=2056292 RepID=A0AAD5Y7V6_9APHY|nr:hypothetical protein NLI96_g12141 [Physisporinus lineatus]
MTRRITKGHAIIRHSDLRRRSIPPNSVKFRLARKILAHYMKTKDKEAALRHYAGCLAFDQSTGCLRKRSTNSADTSRETRSDVSDYVMAESSEYPSIDEICEQFSRMTINDHDEDKKAAADFGTGSYIDASFYSVCGSGSLDSGNASPYSTSTPHDAASFCTAFSGSFVGTDDLLAHDVAKALEDHIIDDLCKQFSTLSLNEQEDKEDWCTAADIDFGASVGSSGSFGFFSASSSLDFHKASLIVSSTPLCVASLSFIVSAAKSMASFVDLAEVPKPSLANVVDDQVMKRLREPSFTLSFFEEDEWHTAADIDVSWSSFSGDVSLSNRSIDNHGDVEDNSSSEPEDECDSDFFDLPVRETGGRGIRTCRRRFRRRQVKYAQVDTLSNSDSVDGPVPWRYEGRWSTRPVIIVAHSPIRIISDSTDSIPALAGDVNARVDDGSGAVSPVTSGMGHSQEVNVKDDRSACDNDGGRMSAHSCDDAVLVNGIDEGRGNDEKAGLELPTTFARTMFSGLRKWLDPILTPFSSSPSAESTEPEQWQVPPPLFFDDVSESSHFISCIGRPPYPLSRLPVFSHTRPFYDDLD